MKTINQLAAVPETNDGGADSGTSTAYCRARWGLLAASGLDETQLLAGVSRALRKGGDYADLYLKSSVAESWHLERGKVTRSNYNQSQGFGLRLMEGEQSVLTSADRFDATAIGKAADLAADAVGHAPVSPAGLVLKLPKRGPTYYTLDDPLPSLDAAHKIALLESVDRACRARSPLVVEVMASLSISLDLVFLARNDGYCGGDVRPLVRLDVAVQVVRNGRREGASRTLGGRVGLATFDHAAIESVAALAVDAALIKLEARAAPAGTMTVVIGPGWNGVMLHEAVGHGLEGDFNRRGSSAFAGRIGQRVAAPGVTIVDDGTVPGSRGSLNIDDEGTPGQCTTLIEDGILVSYMQDSLNARLMGVANTGNGRRESYDVLPMPRMTNTYMRAGGVDPAEIIASVKQGIYIAHLEGGQVDISSGRFMFAASEAFLIENGRLSAPVKGATVLGNGPQSLKNVKLIGNDLEINMASGVCGKAGQSVPVGVGQPTLRIDGMTVGGTA